uniref:Uncharacterized protein n=1 Tax=Macaca fascicularis TaxID=9541 RepID=A0A7N9CKE0_MACFA
FLFFITPASSATLKDLEVRGPEPRCSDPVGQPSNLLSQWGLGAPLPAETAHTHPSPNDCSLYLFPQSSSNSSSLHVPQSRNQELEVAPDSRSATINQLYENIESLKQQKKQVERQLEEEKKANNEIHKAQTEQLETINILTLEKADLKTTLYHTKRAARHFEEESKDLAGRLQYSLQRIQELERALSAVSTQQQEEDRVSPTNCPIPWQPGFPDGGESVKVPSTGCSVLPRRQHAHF